MIELKTILESLLFAAQKPMNPRELREVLATTAAQNEGDESIKAFKKLKEEDLEAALQVLSAEHEAAGRTYRLACVAGSWQFVSQPEFAPWLKALVGHKSRPPRLSAPGLETLAIIAYRQPITRAEIEQVRGVAVDGVMQTLLERGLVAQVGRAEVIGRPMTYGTTPGFLEYFGLGALEDLPAADELRRIPVVKPEALITADPAATPGPDQLPLAPTETAATAPEAATGEQPAAPGAEAASAATTTETAPPGT